MLLMRALLAPLLREVVRSPFVGAAFAVTLPIWYELVRRHHDVQTSATLAVVAGAALFGFALDDPAQPTLNACAVARTPRRWARTVLVATLLGSGWSVVALVGRAVGAELGAVSDRLPEAAAAAALASAFAAVGLRVGVRAPGLTAAMTAVLTMSSATAASHLASRFRWLPRVADPAHATRWWMTAAIAGAIACWCARDPAMRSLAGTVRRDVRRADW